MTDEKIDPLTARVDKINGAVLKLSALAYTAIEKRETRGEQDTVDLINSVGILVGTVVVSLSEIADSVGKLARQNDADFRAAVDAAAEQKATVIHEEATKRSFIGQPKRNG